MDARLVACRDLKVGMRVAKQLVCGDFLLADEGALVTHSLIETCLFLGVRRVAVELDPMEATPGGKAAASCSDVPRTSSPPR